MAECFAIRKYTLERNVSLKYYPSFIKMLKKNQLSYCPLKAEQVMDGGRGCCCGSLSKVAGNEQCKWPKGPSSCHSAEDMFMLRSCYTSQNVDVR